MVGFDSFWPALKTHPESNVPQFMALDAQMEGLESELGSPTAAANRRQPQHRTSSSQGKASGESPRDARRRKRASKALSKPTQRTRSSSAPRGRERTQSDSEIENAHLLANAVVLSRTGLVPSTRSQRDGWLSSVAPAYEEAQKRRSSSAQREQRRRPPPPPRSLAQRQPSPARRSVSASRAGGCGTFGTSARQTGWRGATSVEATQQELRRAEARRRRQLRAVPLEPPQVAGKHTVQSRTRLPERERRGSADPFTRDFREVSQYDKQQLGSRSDLHFVTSLRAPSLSSSERSVRFGDATEEIFDDARSQLSSASEPWHPTSPVRKPHHQDYGWAPMNDSSLMPKGSVYSWAEGHTIMRDVENKIAQMEHDLMLSSSGGSLAIQFTKQQPATAVAAPTLTLQTVAATTTGDEDEDAEEEHGWETYVAKSTGRTYYYHTGTGVSTYTHPSDLAAAAGFAPVATQPVATTITSPRSPVSVVATATVVSEPAAPAVAISREALAVGETIAVYQNGDIQISTAKPRRAKEWKEAGAVPEVDLPALQWVEGLHSFVQDFQKEVAESTAVVAEGGEYRGCNVREMQEALEVLTAWRTELAGTPPSADMHWS